MDTSATSNHSIVKDQYREADFLTGFVCGISGVCDLQDDFSDCLTDEPSFVLKDSVDTMTIGLMNGQIIDNLVMGLFNLDFAMKNFEISLDDTECKTILTNIIQWKEIHRGISNGAVTDIYDKLN